MTSTLVLADAESLADLGRYAARARALDAEGAMRLQALGSVLAAWVAVLPGSGLLGEGAVLGLRTFALGQPADLDLTVPLGAITDRTARAGDGRELPVPPATVVVTWTALTPPRAGWEPGGSLPADLLAQTARAGIDEIAAAVAERGAAAGLVRDRVWRAPLPAGSPAPPAQLTNCAEMQAAVQVAPAEVTNCVEMQAEVQVAAGGAFAAYALGFLRPEGEVPVFRCNRWTRLSAPGGHVLMR